MKRILLIAAVVLVLTACKKQDEWLNKKSNKSDIIPTTLEDFQAILNNDRIMNASDGLTMVSSDNYVLQYTTWQSLADYLRDIYIWKQKISLLPLGTGWDSNYQRINNANIVLDGLTTIAKTTQNDRKWNELKGSALFFRAFNYFDLAQGWCKEYNKQSASTDLGLPLKLRVNVAEKIKRASVQQTYNQIITDLIEAKNLLPASVAFKTQPSKTAASALLARIYLTMGNHESAYSEANTALSSVNTLIDYNILNTTATFPFSTFQLNNPEIIYYCVAATWAPINNANLKVEPALYASYVDNDLRHTILYQNNGTNGVAFKGYYSGMSSIHFSGLATNELYLTRSEAAVRTGKLSLALADLNALLIKRWNKNVTYIPFSTGDEEQALIKILEERRKELPFTGNLRLSDLRRLNKDPRFAITLTRNLNGETYTLPPNDKRYVFPIPDIEIRLSGIEQNER